MEDYEIVEEFETLWARTPKNLPLTAVDGNEVAHVLLLPAKNLRVYVELRVGVRGGIEETVYVFDPSQPIVADRLIVRCVDGGAVGLGAIMPLANLRRQVMSARKGRKKLASQLCKEALWELLDKLDDSPLDPVVLRHLSSTSHSLRRVIPGGLPSHGRRGGGVR